LFSLRALITLLKAVRDKLIFLASLSLSPVAFVFDCLSDPAKSTKFSFPALIFLFFSS